MRSGALIATRAPITAPRLSPAVTAPRMLPCWAFATPVRSVNDAKRPYARTTRRLFIFVGILILEKCRHTTGLSRHVPAGYDTTLPLHTDVCRLSALFPQCLPNPPPI